jgi:hypothetical protein
MIFVSLLQQKNIPTPVKEKPKKPGKITKIKIPAVTKKKVVTAPVKKVKVYSFNGMVEFYPTSKVGGTVLGSFNLTGKFDNKTKKFRLAGISWIKRPKDFAMIPIAGSLDSSGQVIKAKLGHPLCKPFTLIKSSTTGSGPLSGRWEGRYDCTQGITGISITLD